MRRKYKNYEFKMIDINTSIAKHPGYLTLAGMKKRCYNNKSPNFKYYGDRGITICETWKNNSAEFLVWFEENYIEGYSINRIDNDGPYSPKNCRFSSDVEQNKNRRRQKCRGFDFHKRSNRYRARITIDGKEHWLGDFKTQKGALNARKKAEKELLCKK